MDELAEEYGARGFQSFFLYVREAHPGELLPHHTSFAQKLAHARTFVTNTTCAGPSLLTAWKVRFTVCSALCPT